MALNGTAEAVPFPKPLSDAIFPGSCRDFSQLIARLLPALIEIFPAAHERGLSLARAMCLRQAAGTEALPLRHRDAGAADAAHARPLAVFHRKVRYQRGVQEKYQRMNSEGI